MQGVSLNAPGDLLPPGKFRQLTNMRPYVLDGSIQVRDGTDAIYATPLGGAIHSLFRLNDTTPFNLTGSSAIRLIGSGANLYAATLTGQPVLIDTGYSGDPLTAFITQPVGTVQPWIYVVDRLRMRKINIAEVVYQVGIAAPLLPPTAVLEQPGLHVIDDFNYSPTNVPWLPAGAGTQPTFELRVNTTINIIVYDSGSTGNCLIAPGDMTHIGVGMLVNLAGNEDVIVQDVKAAIATTTIAGIVYDNPVTNVGLCTIVPLGGLGTGAVGSLGGGTQPAFVEQVPLLPAHPDITATRPIPSTQSIPAPPLFAPGSQPLAFPLNCLVHVGTLTPDTVRILSVATGPDGTQSFRCSLPSTHVVGEQLLGIPAFRCYTANTHANADTVVSGAIINSSQTPTPTAPYAMGVLSAFAFPQNPQYPITAQPPVGGTAPPSDHTAIIATAKASVEAATGPLSFGNPCQVSQVAILVAQLLVAEGAGVLRKFTGFVCPSTAFGSIEADAVVYPNGQIFFLFVNPSIGDFTPLWGAGPSDAADRYVPIAPGEPTPLPAPTPPPGSGQGASNLNLGMVGGRAIQPDDVFHLSMFWFSPQGQYPIQKVDVYFDVDISNNNFTQNYFWFEADQNALAAAVNGLNAINTTTITNATVTTGLPQQAAQTVEPQFTGAKLPLGVNQWVELRWTVKDMIRVGSDTSRTLANIAAIEILTTIGQQPTTTLPNPPAPPAMGIQYNSLYLTGGANPDSGPTGGPFVYYFRHRSSITGAVSNPSPPLLGGVTPRRQRVDLTGVVSSDPQADLLDWFRFGNTLTVPTYAGSSTTATFVDDYSSDKLIGGETLEFDNFQPWPTTDLPRKGTVNVVGTHVQWATGDQFNTGWAVNTQILLNGIPFTLYAQPASTTVLTTVENGGVQTGIPYQVIDATIAGTPLPVTFGPYNGFWFGVGDPNNPGLLRWSKGNNPDVASDVNSLFVTAASEPLQNGCVWDGIPFVFSSNDLYRIEPDFSNPNIFKATKTPCGRGMWNRWGICLTKAGIVFITEDGICVTAGGSPAVSLTNPDFYSLFPHDGTAGVAINGYSPPNMANLQRLRLACVDDLVYFDYSV